MNRVQSFIDYCDHYAVTYAAQIAALQAQGLNAAMQHTGGGCMAIEVMLPGGYALITDCEAPLSGDPATAETQWYIGTFRSADDGEQYNEDVLWFSTIEAAGDYLLTLNFQEAE